MKNYISLNGKNIESLEDLRMFFPIKDIYKVNRGDLCNWLINVGASKLALKLSILNYKKEGYETDLEIYEAFFPEVPVPTTLVAFLWFFITNKTYENNVIYLKNRILFYAKAEEMYARIFVKDYNDIRNKNICIGGIADTGHFLLHFPHTLIPCDEFFNRISNLHHIGVDLGLPSGLLWADRNVDALHPSHTGGFYAYGEIETKHRYTVGNYKLCRRTSILKNIEYYDMVDAGDEHKDVAYKKWGEFWVMPSEFQFKELIENCTFTWTSEEGTEGCRVRGANGNSIFLPCSGYCDEMGNIKENNAGFMWCTHLSICVNSATALCFSYKKGDYKCIDANKIRGLSVRPVFDKENFLINYRLTPPNQHRSDSDNDYDPFWWINQPSY